MTFLLSFRRREQQQQQQYLSWWFIIVIALHVLTYSSIVLAADNNEDVADNVDTRLLNAAMENRVQDVERALEQGANIDVQHLSSGQTPLMAAVLRGHTQIVKLLLDRGADVSIGEKDGYTPPHGAGFQGRADIMRILHESADDVDVKSVTHDDGYAPLHRACWGREQRHTDTVAVLLELGVDPNMKASSNGKTCAEMTTNEATRRVLQQYIAKSSAEL